uniref:Alpha-tectorin-like n=1 Tax=Pogona vitticeps TaxID=103695 RepID=A0ABM5ESF2_9SAUR
MCPVAAVAAAAVEEVEVARADWTTTSMLLLGAWFTILSALHLGSLYANPCRETRCGRGYVCMIMHNQPQCVPETQTCSTIQCQEGELCEIAEGLPKCVPYPAACHHLQCPEGTICDLTDGSPKCVPVPQTCAAIQCKEGTICVMTNHWPECVPAPASCQSVQCSSGTVCQLINGWPQCLPSQLSCHRLRCQEGTVCKIVHGQSKCVSAPASCGAILCESGTMCEMAGGHAKCVPLTTSCLHVECQPGTVCDLTDGWPKCVPRPSCDTMNCEAGTECKIVNSLPTCLALQLSCDKIICKPGAVCQTLNGKPICVHTPPSCNAVRCEEGTICEITHGSPKCVPAVTSCDNIQCVPGTICQVVNEWPRCVPLPDSCEKLECKEGTVCDVVHGWPTCVPDPTASCASISCQVGTVCEMINSVPTCTPSPLSCSKYQCETGTVCELVQGWPTCVASPPSCQNLECTPGTACKIVDGQPKCVPTTPRTCGMLRCQEGTICKMVDGWPQCVPVPAACGNIHCKSGTICEVVEGWPQCVAIEMSCDQMQCNEGTLCEMVDDWPTCLPITSTCEKVSCDIGSKCEIYEGGPQCLPLSPSCEKFQCGEGAICEMSQGWPKCVPVPTPTSCESVSCNEGTKCEIYDGQPQCLPLSPSCDKFQCKDGTVCQINHGWPQCIPIPIASSCEQVRCTEGNRCEMYNGQPTCLLISPSCDKFQCKDGTTCQIHNGWPKCVPIPIEFSCEHVSCSEGTKCEMYGGQPTCIPLPPSCDKFQCNNESVCQIRNSWPVCVPIPAPIPAIPAPATCENMACSAGTVCEIYGGQPVCLPLSPTCDKFHCNVGSVCHISNGWPLCVPITPSCGNVTCNVGAVCRTISGWPQCVPSPSSCAQFSCSMGTVCQIISGWPQCIPLVPSCDHFHCTQGTVCKLVNHWPHCVPNIPSCSTSRCKEGMICETIRGVPTCVPIPASCDKTRCQQGTVCQTVHGRPTCVPASVPHCSSILCHAGTVCQLINGSPQCVPAPPSCDHFQCRAGTVCNLVNGLPQCVPIPGSCERVRCQRGTICQVVSGRAQCVATVAQTCHTIRCRRGTLCKVVDGSPKCVPAQPIQPACWASGQPHYHTFDGRSYDFQGTCAYTVVKTCRPSHQLPFFHIFTKSQKSSPLFLISHVTVSVYNFSLTMVRYEYGLVRVNQVRSRLPIVLHNGHLSLSHRGNQLVIETQFGLKVYYDWNYYLVVKVTPAFRNHLCGLCGNYNGDPNDDFITSSGKVATNTVEFGKSWKVEDGDRACSHGCRGQCKRCSPELVAKYSSETFCGLITKHQGGPFRQCHALIDPKPYLNDCVNDLCTFDGYKQILCRALKTYADACQREGTTISAWRKAAGCPLTCPDYSQYMACGSACPATCTHPDAPKNCHLPCLETCQCKAGYVLDGGKCIPQSRCGCIYHGQLYAPNERFWGDHQCHQECICRAQDKSVVCQASRCRDAEGCHVVNGRRKCHPTLYGTCTALGQLHYITFDGLRYDFYGTCVYRLAEFCHHRSVNLTYFQVLVQHEQRGLKNPSAGKVTEIKVYGVKIVVSHNQVLLNGLLINLPYNIEYDKVALYRHGWDIVIATDFGLTVTFDGKNNIRLTVPGTYRSLLCGLCGNFNARADDDMMQQSGTLTTSPGDFGRSWKVRDIPGCTEKEKVACPDAHNVERTQRTSKECGILLHLQGPFRLCHSKVAAESYFKDCVFDYCSNKGNKNAICHILSSYAAACQAAGVKVEEWRSTNLCKPNCPANSQYKVCASNCPMTCRSLFNPVPCTAKCHEGCECNEGFVLSGDQCVPISQCGCVHQGFYYKAGDSFYLNGFCKERCVCQVGGIMECHRSSCGPNEECRLVNGVQTCHFLGSKRTGTCHVAGDPHYITFDGSIFDLQSNCSYILAKSCTRQSSVPSFSVNVENERRSKGKVSVTKAVSVTAYQNTISIMREKRGVILVNGATTFLPFRLESDNMWAYYHGDNIVVRTDFGLFVSFDQLYHLIVKVPEVYQGQMCGLCGNFNGRPLDDIVLPDGHPAASIQAFAAAWKVDGLQAACAEDCAASVCGACHASRKANYVHNSQCGILQAPYGPFSACYSTINPANFYNNCVHDLCKARGNPVILCRAIHGYVTACQAAGVVIQPWRTAKFCPMKCPANSHYELCASACPSRCKEATSITKCPNYCAEGCQCRKGYFLAGYHCAPISQCRCFHKGMWLKVGVKVITPNCKEECSCQRQGQVVCTPLPCGPGQACVLSNAKWTCVRQEGHCTVAHGHIFTSYDGVSGKLPLDGAYEISALNDAQSQSWFRVVAQVHKCSTCPTPVVVSVTIYFHKFILLIKQDNSVSVNGHPVHLPIQPSKEISVSLAQNVVAVTHGSDVRVLYSTRGDLTLVVSGTLANKLSKSCGNFNGNGADDLRLPDGRVAHTITEVISHWKVTTATQNDRFKIHSY